MGSSMTIEATSKRITRFFNDNMADFLAVMVPIAPVILLAQLTVLIPHPYMVPFHLFAFFLQIYLLSYIALVWFKLVLDGEEPYGPLGWLKFPKPALLIALVVIVGKNLIVVPPIWAFNLVVIQNSVAALAVNNVLVIVVYLACIFAALRSVFILPAIAEGKKINVLQSCRETAGYEDKIVFSGMLAALPYLILYVVAAKLIPVVEHFVVSTDADSIKRLTRLILMMPLKLFLEPIFVVIAASTISLFYVQSRGQEAV